jgi:hypothetical protein
MPSASAGGGGHSADDVLHGSPTAAVVVGTQWIWGGMSIIDSSETAVVHVCECAEQ